MTYETVLLSDRERAILRAVAAGRAEIVSKCGPVVAVDGCWCDQSAVRTLVSSGLIEPASSAVAADGERCRAVVTAKGWRVLKQGSLPGQPALGRRPS